MREHYFFTLTQKSHTYLITMCIYLGSSAAAFTHVHTLFTNAANAQRGYYGNALYRAATAATTRALETF